MTSKELDKIIRRIDRQFGQPFPKEADFSAHSTHRIRLEIAYQLALMNERLAKKASQ